MESTEGEDCGEKIVKGRSPFRDPPRSAIWVAGMSHSYPGHRERMRQHHAAIVWHYLQRPGELEEQRAYGQCETGLGAIVERIQTRCDGDMAATMRLFVHWAPEEEENEMEKLRAIYCPTGRAAEYGGLALNLYDRCACGCVYCYARRLWPKGDATPSPRKNILQKLDHDAKRLWGDPRPVFLSFLSDPYPEVEKNYGVTRAALEILGAAGLRPRILTKRPSLAIGRDLDLLRSTDAEFGVTLHLTEPLSARELEPNAETLAQRGAALWEAHEARLRTWVSMEPVFYPGQALDIIERHAPAVDVWRIGKLNHYPGIERGIDWGAFLEAAILRIPSNVGYYIKEDLWQFAPAAFPWPRQRDCTRARPANKGGENK